MTRIDERLTLKVTNKFDEPRVLVVEPWASEYLLPPGKSFDVIADGDLSYPLEIELSADHITVYAFDCAGAMITIQHGGRAVEEPRAVSSRVNCAAFTSPTAIRAARNSAKVSVPVGRGGATARSGKWPAASQVSTVRRSRPMRRAMPSLLSPAARSAITCS